MTCTEARLALGAYVLGALDPAERAEVQAHLDGCPACRDELAELAGLPGLLGHLSAAEVEAGLPTPSSTLLDRLLAEVAEAGAERGRAGRRYRRLAAVAAAVVVLAGGGTAAGLALHGGSGAAAGVTVSAADPRTHVAASVRLDPRRWGTELSLQLSGVPSEERCRLVAVARDGHREQAAAWQASYTGSVRVTGAVAIAPADVTRLDVVTFAGRTLVSVPVRHAQGGNALPGAPLPPW